MIIKLGIISDLHCHQLEKHPEEIAYELIHGEFYKTQDSYILTDKPKPIFQDPFLSFQELVKSLKSKGENIDVDYLIMPGDLANKSCPQGLTKGWEITREIGKLMNAKMIFPTVGNHDVDSRKIFKTDPFEFVKKLDDFPSKDLYQNEKFWKNGYCFFEFKEFRILIINSVHNHTSKDEAYHGLFSDEALNFLEAELTDLKDNKIGFAICHHAPMEHSRIGSKSYDLMYNGDQLIQLLDDHNFELIIHGHKHDAMIRYGSGSGDSSAVFSAGSFSGFPDLLVPAGGTNTFHIIEINLNKNSRSTGIINTWFFVPTKGWKRNLRNPYFNNKVGFGVKLDLKKQTCEIKEWFIKGKYKQMGYLSHFLPHFPNLEYLIPMDFERLVKLLQVERIYISRGEISEDTKIEIKR